jgi:8-oxo-dGTP diphosphatase
MGTIKVVCDVIFNNDRLLICRRKRDKALGGYWEFPGGKIEIEEVPEDGLKRELIEELQMKVFIEGHFKTVFHDYGHTKIELISYRCKFLESTFQMVDHDSYEWVLPGQLLEWDLAAADVPIALALIKAN